MWLLLSTRLRRWLLLTLLAPAVSFAARSAAARIERRRGASALTRGLYAAGSLSGRRARRGR